MVTIDLCSECKGKGAYFIHNAYKPEDKEEVICEYCDGCGVVNSFKLVAEPDKVAPKFSKQTELN